MADRSFSLASLLSLLLAVHSLHAAAKAELEPSDGGGGGGTEAWGDAHTLSLSEQTGKYLSDSTKWRWPTESGTGAEKTVHSTLLKWCGGAYAEAIRDAGEKSRTYQRLLVERAQRYNEWMRCRQERAMRELELEADCARAKKLQKSELERDREMLLTECSTQGVLLKAELDACELKLKSKESAACKREVELEKAACGHAKRALATNLTACLQKGKMLDTARLAELELNAASLKQDEEEWNKEKESLIASLAECRPQRAHTEARLREMLADGTIDALEETALWLQAAIGLFAAVLLSLVVSIAWLSAHSERPTGSGSYGWVGAQKPSRMRLVSPEAAKGMLEDAFEGRTRSRLPVVLVTAVTPEGDNATPVVFLLVPVNVASSRRFSLFNTGGDYVQHVEKAKEIVAKSFERSRLVVLLYEGNGSLFSEKTLQSLRLNPDKVAYEAVPKDMDFPKSHNLVVPWVDKALGVRATDSERESDLTNVIKAQPWAQYLLLRSGRWGAAHAQL